MYAMPMGGVRLRINGEVFESKPFLLYSLNIYVEQNLWFLLGSFEVPFFNYFACIALQ